MRSTIVFFAMCAAACGHDESTEAAPAAEPEPEAPPSFAVHEWGLVAVRGYGETRQAMAMSGAPRPMYTGSADEVLEAMGQGGGLGLRTAVGLKPVLYVHVEGGRAVDLSVHVDAPNGAMVETLPASAAGPATGARWNGLRAEGASCASTVPADGPRCATEDGYCEAREDPFYDTTDATCLHLRDGSTRNHLFYRARVDAAALPFTVDWGDDGALVLRNPGSTAVPGPAFRIWEADDRSVHIARFDPPAPGGEVTVPLPTEGDIPATRAAIVAAIRARGLTEQEARAFDGAWASTLFGVPIPEAVAALPLGATPEALVASRDVVLYMLPDELADRVLHLAVEPQPNEVHRALFVRMDTSQPAPTPTAPPAEGEPLRGLGSLGQ